MAATPVQDTEMAAPSAAEIRKALLRLEADGLPGHARLLWATAVGSWADGSWSCDHDVDIRAIYALPVREYLGLGSFLDEFEIQVSIPPLEIDLVAFEVEKAARLILKGHRPTIAWLSCDVRPPLYTCGSDADILIRAARVRREALDRQEEVSADPALPRDLYSALETFIVKSRLSLPGAP